MQSDEWVAPGTANEGAVGPTQTSVAAQAARYQASSSGQHQISAAPSAPQKPVPRPFSLRRQTVVELLDSGVSVVRARRALVLAISALFAVPAALVNALTLSDFGTDESFLMVLWRHAARADEFGRTFFRYALESLTQSFVTLLVAYLVGQWYAERQPSVGALVRENVGKFPTVLLAWVIAHVIQVVALAGFGVGALLAGAAHLVVVPAIALENLGPWAAVKRSYRLVRGRMGAAIMFFLLSGLVAALVGSGFQAIPAGIGQVVQLRFSWVVVGLFDFFGRVVAMAFVAGATVAFYLDLRTRREGLDLSLSLADLFPDP